MPYNLGRYSLRGNRVCFMFLGVIPITLFRAYGYRAGVKAVNDLAFFDRDGFTINESHK